MSASELHILSHEKLVLFSHFPHTEINTFFSPPNTTSHLNTHFLTKKAISYKPHKSPSDHPFFSKHNLEKPSNNQQNTIYSWCLTILLSSSLIREHNTQTLTFHSYKNVIFVKKSLKYIFKYLFLKIYLLNVTNKNIVYIIIHVKYIF